MSFINSFLCFKIARWHWNSFERQFNRREVLKHLKYVYRLDYTNIFGLVT